MKTFMQGLSEGHRVAFETLEQRLLLSVNYPDDFAPQTLELVVGPQATPDGGWYFGPILPGGLQPDALILNRNAADTTNADQLWTGGGMGLNLDGTGITVGVWDGGRVRATHQELVGRVTYPQSAIPYASAGPGF